jgi:hypothetical protein
MFFRTEALVRRPLACSQISDPLVPQFAYAVHSDVLEQQPHV